MKAFAAKGPNIFRVNPRPACAVLVVFLSLALILPGCGGDKQKLSARENVDTLLKKGVRPNEMGMVMILEYHRLGEKESAYTRSIENFKKDLQTLYNKGYRLVRLSQLMSGRIGVPAGTTPVVLSFDDSTESQFRYIKEGGKLRIDPDCALGIMSDFYKKHRDFGYTAIFNYLPAMFDQPRYAKKKVDYLYRNGFEFGDHTVTHPSLARLSDEEVQKEIALPLENMKKLNPRVKVNVLCLPHGSIPRNRDLMYNGSYRGIDYHFKWVLLVGSEPMYPCYHYRNPGRLLPRVQAMDYDAEDGSGTNGSEYWITFFDKRPELRYISDGDKNTVCAPAYMEHRLLRDRLPSGTSFVGY